METVQSTTNSLVRPAKRRRREHLLPQLVLATYRLWLELAARLPGVGGLLVLRRFLTPPRSPTKLSPDLAALWRGANRRTLRITGRNCPMYRWDPEGPSRGRAVVCHGWAADATSMLPIIRDLLARGFTVWAADAPAHGCATGRRATLPDFIRTVHAVLDQTGPIDVVVGHSFGAAAIAMAVTGYPPYGPRREVGGVVLMSSPHSHRVYPNFFVRLLGLSETVRRTLYEMLDHRFGPVDTLRTVGEQLATLRSPLMLVHDEQDASIPVDQMDRIVSSLREEQPSDVLRTHGLGHVRALRDSTVIRAVGAFAERCRHKYPEATDATPASSPPEADTRAPGLSVGFIADFLRDQIRATANETLKETFAAYVRLLRLQSVGGNDQDARARIARCLDAAPEHSELLALIDQTEYNAMANPYLIDAVHQLDHHGLEELCARPKHEWASDAVDVVVYAALLQRLTSALRQDWRSVRTLAQHWRAERTRLRWRKHAKRFVILKLLSVEYPLLRLLKRFQTGSVPSSYLRTALRINILEAVGFDLARGLPDNAAAGATLARSGHRGARVTPDTQGLQVDFLGGRAWADLYTVWNMGFLLHYETFPWAFAKLLIPQVTGYGPNGDAYIYNRAIALYLHVHMCAFRAIEWNKVKMRKEPSHRPSRYGREKLVKVWGASARRSAVAFKDTTTTVARTNLFESEVGHGPR